MKKLSFIIIPFIAFMIGTSFVNKGGNILEKLPADIQKNIFLLKTAFTQEELLQASTEDIKNKTGIDMSENSLKQLKNAITYESKINKNNKENNEENTKKEDVNIFAILGFIFAFLVSIAGLVLSIIGLSKSKKMGGTGRGLSIAGIVISSIVLFITIIIIISFAVAVSAAAAAL